MTDKTCFTGLGENAPVHPWYKERLRTKCLKDPVKKQQLCGALDGRGWRFLNPGQDDFRDGYPALHCEPFTQPQCGIAPPVLGLVKQARPATLLKKRFTKEQACYSKLNCLRQARRQYVEAVEQRLRAHPLALYPHLTSDLQPELFDDVLSVLDPEMRVKRESDPICFPKEEACSAGNVATCEGPKQKPSKEETKLSICAVSMAEGVKGCNSGNPYKLQEAKETKAKDGQMVSNKFLHSPSQDEDIKEVIKLFSDWAASLGGETTSLTESTIHMLFFNGFDSQIPKELPTTGKDYSHSAKQKDSELNKVCTSNVKTTYGAWYLDPKTWKKRPANEPLRDPSVTEDLELELQPTEKDKELKQIHGTQAFREFIISKGLRMPRFLSSLFLEEEHEYRTRGTDATASASTRKGTAML
ncbi:protein FAM47E [Salminus brasiliensis]|uniref:protein FAM47E n=1 Tax=Salminus brasiliensis TaxID=930266 RepID=UPI003B82D083